MADKSVSIDSLDADARKRIVSALTLMLSSVDRQAKSSKIPGAQELFQREANEVTILLQRFRSTISSSGV